MKNTIALIGIGSIGFRHLNNIINNFKDIEQIYVYDINQQVVYKKIKSLKNKKIILLKNKKDILKHKVNLALICTPTFSHYTDSIAFIDAGTPVFIEKPFTIKYKECVELIKRKKNHIFIGCNMRYHPAIKKAKEIIQKKELGKIISAHAYFGHFLGNWKAKVDYRKTYHANNNLSGGILFDCIHELDYLTWLFGDVKKCFSIKNNMDVLSIESDEVAKVILQHNNGILSSVHLDYIQPVKRRGLEIIGSNGTFLWNSTGKDPEKLEVVLINKTTKKNLINEEYKNINDTYVEELKEILSILKDNVANNTSLLTSECAMKTIKVLNKL